MSDPQRNTMTSAGGPAGVTATILLVGGVFLLVALTVKFPQLYILATYEDLSGDGPRSSSLLQPSLVPFC